MIPPATAVFTAAQLIAAGRHTPRSDAALSDLLAEIGDQIQDGRTDIAVTVLDLTGVVVTEVLGAGAEVGS